MNLNKAKSIIISEFDFDSNGFFNKLLAYDFSEERYNNLLLALFTLQRHTYDNNDWDFLQDVEKRESKIIFYMISISEFAVDRVLENDKKLVRGINSLDDLAEEIIKLFNGIKWFINYIEDSIKPWNL